MAIERSLKWQKISKQRTSSLFDILITGAPRNNPMNISGKSLEKDLEKRKDMAGKNVNREQMKAEMFPELNWHRKRAYRAPYNSAHVTVTLRKGGRAKEANKLGTQILCIAFRDNMFKQFNSEYIMFAVRKNRLYFKGAEPFEGYKVTVKGTTGYMQSTLRKEEIAEYEAFAKCSNFTLHYDKYLEMYYVDTECPAADNNISTNVPVETNLCVTVSSDPLAKEPQKKKPGRKPKTKVKDVKATVKEVKNEQEVPV